MALLSQQKKGEGALLTISLTLTWSEYKYAHSYVRLGCPRGIEDRKRCGEESDHLPGNVYSSFHAYLLSTDL